MVPFLPVGLYLPFPFHLSLLHMRIVLSLVALWLLACAPVHAQIPLVTKPAHAWEIGLYYTPTLSINAYNTKDPEGEQFIKDNAKYLYPRFGSALRVAVARRIVRFLYLHTGLEYQRMAFRFNRPEDVTRQNVLDQTLLYIDQRSDFFLLPLGLDFRLRPRKFVVIFAAPEVALAVQLRTWRDLRLTSGGSEFREQRYIMDDYHNVTAFAGGAVGIRLRPLRRHHVTIALHAHYQFVRFQKRYDSIPPQAIYSLNENMLSIGLRLGYTFGFGRI